MRKRIETVLNISGTQNEMYSGFAIMLLMTGMAFIKMSPLTQDLVCNEVVNREAPMQNRVCLDNKILCNKQADKTTKPQNANIKKRVITKRIYKYEPLNTNQDLVFEDPSNHGFNVELEKAIRNELNQKTKTLLKIKQIGSEPNHTTDGGS